MTNITKMNDREILELILTNQVFLAQEINRIKGISAKQFPKEYSESYKSKIDTFKDLIENSDDFLRESSSEEY